MRRRRSASEAMTTTTTSPMAARTKTLMARLYSGSRARSQRFLRPPSPSSGDARMLNGADYLTAKELAQKLEGKREGNYWKAHCPAHEDAKSSLSISEKASTVCFAVTPAVARTPSLVLKDRGLWPERPANGQASGSRTIVGRYDYVDQAGDLQFQVVRYAPKDFRQRRRPRPDRSTGQGAQRLGVVARWRAHRTLPTTRAPRGRRDDGPVFRPLRARRTSRTC